VRRLLVGLCRLLLRIFFRRIEIAGGENLPASGPVMFVLNHPNGLIDPLFILAFAGRPVSFLAKEPLFRWPVIGAALRSLDALPVYRAKDHADATDLRAQNAHTFESARAILSRGGSLAIFPEGTSHSDPQLRPLKTGAARIALGAAAVEASRGSGAALPLHIVPAGLTYTDKKTFRSDALVCIGVPFAVPHVALDANGEPPHEPVRELTTSIGQALGKVTLQADRVDTLRAIDAARRVFSADEPEGERALARALALGQQIGKAEASLRFAEPLLVREVTDRVLAHEAGLRALGVTEEQLHPPRLDLAFVGRRLLTSLVWIPVLLPALLGVLLNYLPYRFTGLVARRAVRSEEDVVATAKALSAALAFPLTWIALALVGLFVRGPLLGLALLVAAPALGYLALRVQERLTQASASVWAMWAWCTRRAAFVGLLEEQRALRELMGRIADSLPGESHQA
jgi:glycerol-3-phosphate O-acyltransferase/dihydroxyacetone phosphate acyltransferase